MSQLVVFQFEQNNKPIIWEGEIFFTSNFVSFSECSKSDQTKQSKYTKPNISSIEKIEYPIKFKKNFLRVNVSTEMEVLLIEYFVLSSS